MGAFGVLLFCVVVVVFFFFLILFSFIDVLARSISLGSSLLLAALCSCCHMSLLLMHD